MVYELVKNIDRERYEPVVLCYGSRQNTPLEQMMIEQCPVIFAGITKHIGIMSMLKVLHLIARIKPDLIHAHMGGITFAIPWSCIRKTPVVLTVHTDPKKAFSRKNGALIKKFVTKNRFRMVAVSKENLKLIKEFYGIETNCVYINNGIDINKYYSKEHNCFTYLNVARHDDNKNQEAIIRAFSEIYHEESNVKLILVGDGPNHRSLVDVVEALNIQDVVQFTGLVSDPSEYYNISDVYVQSSHREALPLSVLEAMAAGLPVVATNVGGLKDVINRNGILVDDYNLTALTDAMRALLKCTQTEYKRMSVESKLMVEDFSSSKMAFKYQTIYSQLMSEVDI